MNYYDAIIIGAGPGGISAAISAKQHYPEKSVLIIEKENLYPSSGVNHIINNYPEIREIDFNNLESHDVEIMVGEAIEIRRDEKTIIIKNYENEEEERLVYDKLILSTGSKPIIPLIKGIEKKGVFPITKKLSLLESLKEKLKASENIVIMGGGLIGIEFSAYLVKELGKKVFLVEKEERLAKRSFDPEFGEIMKNKLAELGVKIILNDVIEEFAGEEELRRTILKSGIIIDSELALIAIGYAPEVSLARKAGLELAINNTIRVNEYMMTSDNNIFAVGDCAEKKDFFTRKTRNLMLASIATSEGRTAGASLYELDFTRIHQGSIRTYSGLLADNIIATVGYTEEMALQEGFEIITGFIELPPIPETNINKELTMKLIFTAQTGVLLGAEIIGGMAVTELINVLSTAIQKTMTITELESLQVATNLGVTYPPTIYPIIKAAEKAHLSHRKKGHFIIPSE